MVEETSIGAAVEVVTAASEEEYAALAEECQAILTERGFNARSETILARWELGEAVLNSPWYSRHSRDHGAALARLGADVGLSARNVYYCLQFARAYPTFKAAGLAPTLQAGKEITWTDIRESLTAGADAPEDKPKAAKPKADKKAAAFLSHARVGHVWSLADHNALLDHLAL